MGTSSPTNDENSRGGSRLTKVLIFFVLMIPLVVYTAFVEVRFEGGFFETMQGSSREKRDLKAQMEREELLAELTTLLRGNMSAAVAPPAPKSHNDEGLRKEVLELKSMVQSLIEERDTLKHQVEDTSATKTDVTTGPKAAATPAKETVKEEIVAATPEAKAEVTTAVQAEVTTQVQPRPPSADCKVPAIDYNYDFIGYQDYKTRFPVPDWMEEMLASQPANDPQAHHEMLSDPNNKFIVMTCHMHSGNRPEECGGFTDRVALFPYYLWLAHKTGRKFLIKYSKPYPLEGFLVPPKDGFDWRLPDGYLDEDWWRHGNRTFDQFRRDRRQYNFLLDQDGNVREDSPRVLFVQNNLAIPACRGKVQDTAIGANADDIWAGLWRRLFQPSPEVANAMAPLISQYSLEPGNYAATHLRVKWNNREYAAKIHYVDQKKWWKADQGTSHMNMTHPDTLWVLSTLGDHAITCALRIMPETKYVYLASDGYEVVDFLKNNSTYWSDDATDSPPRSWPGADPALENSPNGTDHGWGVPAWEVQTNTAKIIARPDYKELGVHFDQGVWKDPAKGYSVFVDMWMMMHAKCHSHGVGGYGRFTSLLSGNRKICASRHRDYSSQQPSCASPTERKAWKKLHPDIKYPKRQRRRRRRI